MRFQILLSLFALFFVAVLGAAPQKAILVSYPDDTPASVIDTAMEEIRKAGGIITHEYKLLKGFAAKATETTIEALHTLEQEFPPTIEEDRIVSIDGDFVNGHEE